MKKRKKEQGHGSVKKKTGGPVFRREVLKVDGKNIESRVEAIVSKICEDENLELVHVEFIIESQKYYLRIYIDREGGVTMGDCAQVSRQLADILDVHQIIDVEYRLEVSSPGINRPLFKKSDYTKYAGRCVVVKTSSAIEGKKKFTGILGGISEKDCVTISMDGQIFEIDFSSIKKARLAENNGDDRC